MKNLTKLRNGVQAAIFILCLVSGYRLYLFVGQALRGGPPAPRPAMVAGFLPIGGLMGLRLWLSTGIFDRVHPAAIIILSAAIVVSALFKKGFCGWICPVGALSEALWKTGKKVSGRDFRLGRSLDYALRSVKYLLLAFFALTVFLMSSWSLAGFLNSPYWVIADARMLWFFEHLSTTAFIVLAGLAIGSFFYRNFWCRYFCPYGALLGLLSLLSPAKIIRNEKACARCGACRENCHAHIPVDNKTVVRTPECNGCLACVDGCPAPGALGIGFGKIQTDFLKSRFLKSGGLPSVDGPSRHAPYLYAAGLLAVFFGAVAWAMLSGHWASGVPYAEYQRYISMVRFPG